MSGFQCAELFRRIFPTIEKKCSNHWKIPAGQRLPFYQDLPDTKNGTSLTLYNAEHQVKLTF